MPRSRVARSMAKGRQRRTHAKPKNHMFLLPARASKYPVGVVLTLPGEGSALGRLGVGVQVLGNSQARGWGDPSNSIFLCICILSNNLICTKKSILHMGSYMLCLSITACNLDIWVCSIWLQSFRIRIVFYPTTELNIGLGIIPLL